MGRRRVFRLVAVVGLLAAGMWYATSLQRKADKPFGELGPLLQPETKLGWRVARPPDVAGPYRRDTPPTLVPRGQAGNLMYPGPAGFVTVRMGVSTDVDQMGILLKTESGATTAVVLER